MDTQNREITKYLTLIAIVVLGASIFFLLRPVFISIVTGLFLAYVCLPLYRKTLKFAKNKNLSATIILVLVILIILVPLWFALPIVIKQAGDVYLQLQTMDFSKVIKAVMPTAS